MFGLRAADACRDAVVRSHSSAPLWSEEGCRTFGSVVEEFFNMKVGARAPHTRSTYGLQLKRAEEHPVVGTPNFNFAENAGEGRDEKERYPW